MVLVLTRSQSLSDIEHRMRDKWMDGEKCDVHPIEKTMFPHCGESAQAVRRVFLEHLDIKCQVNNYYTRHP
jgi:hypothetical protein